MDSCDRVERRQSNAGARDENAQPRSDTLRVRGGVAAGEMDLSLRGLQHERGARRSTSSPPCRMATDWALGSLPSVARSSQPARPIYERERNRRKKKCAQERMYLTGEPFMDSPGLVAQATYPGCESSHTTQPRQGCGKIRLESSIVFPCRSMYCRSIGACPMFYLEDELVPR